MAYNSKVINKVINDFENKSKIAVAVAEKKRSEIYGKLPELLNIDRKLTGTYIELIDVISNQSDNIDIKIANIKNKNKNLQKQRKLLLKENGYPENYTDPIYECGICEDTGYRKMDAFGREEVMCDCMKQSLAAESLRISGLGKIVRTQNFENFRLDYYEKKAQNSAKSSNSSPTEKEKVVPYERMEEVLKISKDFAENFGESENTEESEKNLMFIGPTGLGKTHLSSAIAAEIIKKGFDVLYDTAQSILYSFEKQRFAKAGTFDSDILDRYMTCDLLIIDDLGTEYSGNMSVTSLYNIINTRLIENKSMIISTNLSLKEMKTKYDDSIVSRIFGNFSVLEFIGDDIRFKKL
ncbi:MAG: ATP-binding protein [Oscillospiraceae bacterium]|nr:ATP-binding protein [Oscillospiraceae bacterium]